MCRLDGCRLPRQHNRSGIDSKLIKLLKIYHPQGSLGPLLSEGDINYRAPLLGARRRVCSSWTQTHVNFFLIYHHLRRGAHNMQAEAKAFSDVASKEYINFVFPFSSRLSLSARGCKREEREAHTRRRKKSGRKGNLRPNVPSCLCAEYNFNVFFG